MWQRLHTGDHKDVARSFQSVGRAYGNLGDLQKSLDYTLKAHLMWQRLLPDDSRDLAASFGSVGDAYTALQDYQQAVEYRV